MKQTLLWYLFRNTGRYRINKICISFFGDAFLQGTMKLTSWIRIRHHTDTLWLLWVRALSADQMKPEMFLNNHGVTIIHASSPLHDVIMDKKQTSPSFICRLCWNHTENFSPRTYYNIIEEWTVLLCCLPKWEHTWRIFPSPFAIAAWLALLSKKLNQ